MSHAKLEVRMESLLPFLQGTCTPYNMPVYPGAQRIIAEALIEASNTTSPHRALDFVFSVKTHKFCERYLT